MVTLRRDVAVVNSNRVFDKVEGALTNYDLFMREKNQSERTRATVGYANATPNQEINYFGAFPVEQQVTVEEAKPQNFASYDEYMRAQIHRTSASSKVLTEEEYEAEKYQESTNRTAKKVSKRRLSRASRIFVGAYVAVTVCVTAVILALNLGGAESIPQKANADVANGISALAIEHEVASGNWFDSFCDSLSNK